MTRNLSLILGELANPTAKAIAAQWWALDSLATVVMDNHMALDYLLTEQGGIYAVVNSILCTWINTSREVEIQLYKIREQAPRSWQISPHTPLSFDLFNWLKPSGLSSWLRIIIQTGFIILLLILLYIVILEILRTCCLSNVCRSDTPKRARLFQCLEMISNAYHLDKIQTVGGKGLRVLPPTLPCCSHVAWVVFN